MPIADMRGVVFDGHQYSRRTGLLCERCGSGGTCDLQNEGETLKVCKSFKPILLFQNVKGTQGNFSTIRLGKAWSERLVSGSKVTLSNKAGAFGTATVLRVERGDKADIIHKSIFTNHLMLDSKASSNEERIQQMEKIVRNSYGNIIYKHNHLATLIELVRDDDQVEKVHSNSKDERTT